MEVLINKRASQKDLDLLEQGFTQGWADNLKISVYKLLKERNESSYTLKQKMFMMANSHYDSIKIKYTM